MRGIKSTGGLNRETKSIDCKSPILVSLSAHMLASLKNMSDTTLRNASNQLFTVKHNGTRTRGPGHKVVVLAAAVDYYYLLLSPDPLKTITFCPFSLFFVFFLFCIEDFLSPTHSSSIISMARF